MASPGFITGSSEEPLHLLSGNLAVAQLRISPGGKVERSRGRALCWRMRFVYRGKIPSVISVQG